MNSCEVYSGVFINDFACSVSFGESVSDKVDKPAADSVSRIHNDVEKTESESRTFFSRVSFDRNRNNGRNKGKAECERNETYDENDNRIGDECHRQTRKEKEYDTEEHYFSYADRVNESTCDHTDAGKEDRPDHNDVSGGDVAYPAVSRKPESKHRVHRGISDILNYHVSEKDPHVARRFMKIFNVFPNNNTGSNDTGNKKRDS